MIPDEDEMTHHIFFMLWWSKFKFIFNILTLIPTNQPTNLSAPSPPPPPPSIYDAKKTSSSFRFVKWKPKTFFFRLFVLQIFFSCVKKKRFLSWLLFSRTFVCVHVCVCVCSLYINQSHVFRLKKKNCQSFFFVVVVFSFSHPLAFLHPHWFFFN